LAFLVEFGVEDEVPAFAGAVDEEGVLVGFVLHGISKLTLLDN
jgi:hypothetical protein